MSTTAQMQSVHCAPFEPLLNSREAATLLHLHFKTIERWARSGELPAFFIAGRWYFRASLLDSWLQSRYTADANPSVVH
jgi:excisionase family DNA binding protein